MAEITIFEDDAFSVSTLTASINEQPVVPGRIGSLNLFDEEGISTTTVQIEKDGDTLALVPAGQRGQRRHRSRRWCPLCPAAGFRQCAGWRGGCAPRRSVRRSPDRPRHCRCRRPQGAQHHRPLNGRRPDINQESHQHG